MTEKTLTTNEKAFLCEPGIQLIKAGTQTQ